MALSHKGMTPPAVGEYRIAAHILDAMPDAYITLDRDFRTVYANAASRIHTKSDSTSPGDIYWENWPAFLGTQVEVNLRRVLVEQRPARFTHHYFVPGEGDTWLNFHVYPASEEDGSGLHLVCRDVTEQVQREERNQFLANLAERARALAHDPDAVIADAVRSLGKFLGVSRCTYTDIDLISSTAIIHPDYCAEEMETVAGELPLSTYGSFLITEFKEGRAVVVDDVQEELTRFAPETIAAYEAYGVRAYIAAPLVRSERLVSTISVHSTMPRRWTPDEVELLRAVVQRTRLTVEVARKYHAQQERANHQTRVAEALAQSLLIQPDLMHIDGVEVYPYYEPAANQDRIGGDIYDAFALDGGGIALIVGDATGKGIVASTYAADIKFSLRAYLRLGIGADVFVVLRQMNRHVFDRQRLDGRPQSALLCLAMAVLEPSTGDLRIGGAGTEPPLILRAASGQVETIDDATGQIFGLSANWSGSVISTVLECGDVLALYTDGLTEARPGKRGAFFGPEGVARAVAQAAAIYPLESLATVPLHVIAKAIMDTVREHAGGTLNDDCCLLLARRVGKESPGEKMWEHVSQSGATIPVTRSEFDGVRR